MEQVTLILIVGLISCLFHLFIKNYWLAVVVSPPVISLVAILFDWAITGYFDQLSIFTFVFTLFYTSLASLIIGIPFVVVRKMQGVREANKGQEAA